MIDIFIKKEQLVKDITAKNLAEPYFRKAKSNLITMEILSKVEKHKELLTIPKDHSTEEWVVVVAYGMTGLTDHVEWYDGPYSLDEYCANRLMEAYNIPLGKLNLQDISRTNPFELERVASQK